MRRARRFPRPGSWPWLLAHELRLLWRAFGVRSRIIAALGILFVLLAHLGGYVAARADAVGMLLRHRPEAAIVISVFVGLLVLSSAFGLAVRVLLERGDIELMMSSPMPMTTVYGVRGLTVAVGSVASMGLFLLPLANMGPFAGRWRMLAAWPALAATGLLCAALALAATLMLVRWLGVRRACVASQVIGAAIGIGFVLSMQVGPLLPARMRHGLELWLRAEAHGGWLSAESPLLWPMRAFAGEGLPLLGVVALGVVMFLCVVRLTHRAFLRALQDAPQADAARNRRSLAARDRAFRSGLVRVVLMKEITLVARDPALIARALLQALYLVPLFIIMVQRAQPAPVLAAALVVLSASLASTLAWITVSGEEAVDLIASAPVDLERIRWLKVGAALLPVAMLALPALAWFAHDSIATALVAAAFIALALASCAVVQVWSTPLGGGRDFRKRYRQNPFVSIAETLCSLAWAAACWLAFSHPAWTPAAVALACVAPAAAWLSGRRERA
jgi:ABC-2 type transport system permease protein